MTDTNMIGNFGGCKIIQSPLLAPDYFAVALPPASNNRSRRIIKKLMQRVRNAARPVWTSVILMRDPFTGREVIVCHPSLYAQLAKNAA